MASKMRALINFNGIHLKNGMWCEGLLNSDTDVVLLRKQQQTNQSHVKVQKFVISICCIVFKF